MDISAEIADSRATLEELVDTAGTQEMVDGPGHRTRRSRLR
jgi:hypothetical protein